MERKFPIGVLALVSFLVSVTLFLVIIFGTFAKLKGFAGGLVPFDSRSSGYSLADAQALVTALGEAGRDYYAKVQLRLDTLYPATYGVSRALCLYWLALPGRATGKGLGFWVRAALVLLACLVMLLDWSENAAISSMLENWQNLDPSLVATASFLTIVKSIGSMVTETALLLLFAAFLIRIFRTRRANQD